MIKQFSRTELLLGKEAMNRLAAARVAVFGVGGVGGYVIEALARSGVGAIDIIDNDKVCLSNLNRQIIATRKTIGQYKVDAMRERILEINPDCKVTTYQCFYLPENKDEFDFTQYSYVIDAVDTVTAKIQLVLQAQERQIPIISSMGAGNKLNPAEFQVADIYQTSVCPLAKVMRRELKKRGVKKLKVVYSKEKPIKPMGEMEDTTSERKATPGSTAFVPSVVGLIIASEVIKDITMIDISKLDKNIKDVVYESQVKLGYEKRKVAFYYPLEALNNLLCTDFKESQMQDFLDLHFSHHITHQKERFCIEVSEEYVEKIHREYQDGGFLEAFILCISKHGCGLNDLLAVFNQFSENVAVEKMQNEDFDYLIYFENGKPDEYRYCIKFEGNHAIYHRYTSVEYDLLMK